VPSAFSIDPTGSFVFAAGTATGRLATYRVNGDTGALTPLGSQAVGGRPAAVLAILFGD
jgi:6-phosphogluconolactonase (cycloisomerase 2 family)